MRSQISDLEMALEERNKIDYELKRQLAAEKARIEKSKEIVADMECSNQELRAELAEKERIIAEQHRDLTKMRNHSLQRVSFTLTQTMLVHCLLFNQDSMCITSCIICIL